MNLPAYQLKSEDEFQSYQFISEGSQGLIPKKIQFKQINVENVYNLGFGNLNTLTGEIDDTVISNNGDSEKVLATAVGAVFAFLKQYPDAWIFATGSTSSRTRLYQIGISRHLDYIKADLEIYGQLQGQWLPFRKDVSFEAFLVRSKS